MHVESPSEKMKDCKLWPSRRLQIGAFVLLAVGAAITAFFPPLSREKRAQEFYESAWFEGFPSHDARPERQAQQFSEALVLCPGNSIYEQGLVWNYPRQDLLKLLKGRNLGTEATRLAYGRYYTSRSDDMLHKALKLRQADPKNSIAYYYAAGCLSHADRLEEVYASVRDGNALGKGRFYEPDTTESISGTLVGPMLLSSDFTFAAKIQSGSRALAELAQDRLRKGDVQGACDALEACCRMGVNYACSTPHSIIQLLVGYAMFREGWTPLKKICKDFGMHEELARYSRIDKVLTDDTITLKAWYKNRDIMQEGAVTISSYALPIELSVGLMTSTAMLVLFALWNGVWRLAAKRRKQQSVLISPWGEGWLCRVFLSAYSVVIVLSLLPRVLVSICPHWRIPDWIMSDITPFGLVVFAGQLVIFAIIAKREWKAFVASSGENIGFLKFIFKGTSSRHVWISWSLVRATGAQILFLIAVGFVTIMLFKPIVGVHPWQLQRIPNHSPSKEAAMVKRLSVSVTKACPAEWHMER